MKQNTTPQNNNEQSVETGSDREKEEGTHSRTETHTAVRQTKKQQSQQESHTQTILPSSPIRPKKHTNKDPCFNNHTPRQFPDFEILSLTSYIINIYTITSLSLHSACMIINEIKPYHPLIHSLCQ